MTESSDPKALTFRGMSRLYWGYFWFGPLIGALGIADVLSEALSRKPFDPALALGIFMCVLAAPLVALNLLQLRRTVITDHLIRLPRFFKTNLIPIDEVTGVGMVFIIQPGNPSRSPGWYVQVWNGGGERTPVLPYFAIREPHWSRDRKRKIAANLDSSGLPFEGNSSALALTRGGQIATSIYSWVSSRQGPEGVLAMRAWQKNVRSQSTGFGTERCLAWWSPDGTMGRAE